jgi:sulfite exporter TauE/SafE
MIELSMIFVGGLLGSAHCVGMCGGFALSIGMQAAPWPQNLARQGIYTAGRLATYTLVGAIVGYAGWRLNRSLTGAVPAQAILSLVAGIVLVLEGLWSSGWLPRPAAMRHAPCLVPGMLRTYLSGRGLGNVFLAGVATGFLPCGLVYGFLALASASGTMWQGGLRMMLFGLGTAPLMIATGLSGSLVRLSLRRHAFRIAAWCVLATGLLSIARGVQVFTAVDHAACPLCDRG